MDSEIKFSMHVAEINEEEKFIYAKGYLHGDSGLLYKTRLNFK